MNEDGEHYVELVLSVGQGERPESVSPFLSATQRHICASPLVESRRQLMLEAAMAATSLLVDAFESISAAATQAEAEQHAVQFLKRLRGLAH